jgi:hypothetical protein
MSLQHKMEFVDPIGLRHEFVFEILGIQTQYKRADVQAALEFAPAMRDAMVTDSEMTIRTKLISHSITCEGR